MLKNLNKSIAWNAFKHIAWGTLKRRLPVKLVCPFYHLISDDDLPHIQYLYKPRTLIQFRKDLQFIIKYYKPVSLKDVHNSIISHKPLSNDSILITIDDGYRECYDFIAPELAWYGIPAVFFLTTSFLDNKSLFSRNKASLLCSVLDKKVLTIPQISTICNLLDIKNPALDQMKSTVLSLAFKDESVLNKIAEVIDYNFDHFLRMQQPYMTSQMVDSLIRQGFEVGAHSASHKKFLFLTEEEKIHEIQSSMEFLEKKFSPEIKSFAFPFDDESMSSNIYGKLKSNVDLFFAAHDLIDDPIPFVFHRFWMEKYAGDIQIVFKRFYFEKMIRKLRGKDFYKRP